MTEVVALLIVSFYRIKCTIRSRRFLPSQGMAHSLFKICLTKLQKVVNHRALYCVLFAEERSWLTNPKYCLFHVLAHVPRCLVISPFYTRYRSSAVTHKFYFQEPISARHEKEQDPPLLATVTKLRGSASRSKASQRTKRVVQELVTWILEVPSRLDCFAPPEARSVFLTDHTEKSSVGIITTSIIKLSTMATSLSYSYPFLLSDRHCKSPGNNNHEPFPPCRDHCPS
ncbi:hypothetical protein N431DRAFT_133820 [Stipitochalara longipes BDJ]|nr:hypothetical protein N431DRAFT_133820 [Stipitochalara longipes BDJ]